MVLSSKKIDLKSRPVYTKLTYLLIKQSNIKYMGSFLFAPILCDWNNPVT
jgi:hypothetical protein